MEELQQIFTEMLNHIDKHKEAYDKPQWTNEAIVKTWIKTNQHKLKNLFIPIVSQRSELLAFAKKMQDIGFNEMDDAEKVVDIYIKANCG